MVPPGRGQRELIIGDRQIGKSAVAVDAIINQSTGIKVCLRQSDRKRLRSPRLYANWKSTVRWNTPLWLRANASDPASMQFLAPFAGCSMGEYYRDRGKMH